MRGYKVSQTSFGCLESDIGGMNVAIVVLEKTERWAERMEGIFWF